MSLNTRVYASNACVHWAGVVYADLEKHKMRLLNDNVADT